MLRSREWNGGNAHGYSLLETGEFDQAVEQFQGVANSSPSEPNPWDSLGEGYLANSMPDKALEAYSRALTIEPALEPSLLGRGLRWQRLAAMTKPWRTRRPISEPRRSCCCAWADTVRPRGPRKRAT